MHHLQTPMFQVESDWRPPAASDLPDLRNEKIVGLDTETFDPDIKTKGPGVRRSGYMVGISVAVPDGHKWYLPFDHAEGVQLDKEVVMRWAKDNLTVSGQTKVGANLLYDLDYLYHAGIKVSGPFHDIQVAEPLINENRKVYNLNSLALRYLGIPKTEQLLEDACKNWGFKGSPQAHIWRLPAKFTGPYAEDDALLPIKIFEKQKKILAEQGLEKVFDLETRLIPMLLHMRQVGVRVDVDKICQLREAAVTELAELKKQLHGVDIWAAESIAHAFEKEGLWYPRTPKTNRPSFTKPWLQAQEDHPFISLLLRARELDKRIGTFYDSQLLGSLVGDRIHTQFNQLRADKNDSGGGQKGAVSGRMSSSGPNLQFIPSRTKEGKLLRTCFIPDEGHGWCKADYSNIEIRILAHYAMGQGADAMRKKFFEQRNVDFHKWAADEAGCTRAEAKNANFLIIYGGGAATLSDYLNCTVDEAKAFMAMYFRELPFIKKTVQTCAEVAEKRGYVKTIYGRRRRFHLWESSDWELSKMIKPTADISELKEQIEMHRERNPRYKTGIRRAKTYKAFNAVDQGSAADLMKQAMVDVWESGLCDELKMHLTVHDELDFGYPLSERGIELVKEVSHTMEQAIKFNVPVVVDPEIGPNWGQVEDINKV